MIRPVLCSNCGKRCFYDASKIPDRPLCADCLAIERIRGRRMVAESSGSYCDSSASNIARPPLILA